MENYEAVRKAFLGNRANTFGAARLPARDLRRGPGEAEDALAGSRAMALTTQTPHALYAMLLKCGAVEAIEVPEEQGAHAGSLPSDGAGSAGAADAADVDGGADVAVADSPSAELPDQPVDYLLHTTEAGRAALDEFEPTKRFSELLAAEPDGYGDAYGRVLALCEAGASKAAIEEAGGASGPELPKQIYSGYFISGWRP
ncbi:MAG: hypothetical protein ACLSDQ_06645 [Adlercreutzia equolifaciens]